MPEGLAAFVDEVGRFYLADKKLRRKHDAMAARLAAGGEFDARETRAYLAAVRAYFTGFEREARAHLADLDRRLARVAQQQFNLTAERGVAVRRVEVTQGVLAHLAKVAPR